MNVKLSCLNELADIVVRIDEDKNIADSNLVALTDCGIAVIAKMKRLGLDIGILQEAFVGM